MGKAAGSDRPEQAFSDLCMIRDYILRFDTYPITTLSLSYIVIWLGTSGIHRVLKTTSQGNHVAQRRWFPPPAKITPGRLQCRAVSNGPEMDTTKAQWDPDRVAGLTEWYGRFGNFDLTAPGEEGRVLETQPGSTNGRILNTLQDLLDGKTNHEIAADTLASVVISAHDPDRAWGFFTNMTSRAAEFQEQTDQQKLVDMLINLVKLPHSLPTASYPTAMGPGEKRMAELPNFGFTLSDRMQGPRAYVCRLLINFDNQLVTQAAQLAAATRFRNIFTFAALCTRAHYEQKLPMSTNMMTRARSTLAETCEQGPGRAQTLTADIEYMYLRDRPLLWAEAAASWMLIAGDYISESILEDPEGTRIAVGPMWREQGGTDLIKDERWYFWQQRFRVLAEKESLGTQCRNALAAAAEAMRTE